MVREEALEEKEGQAVGGVGCVVSANRISTGQSSAGIASLSCIVG